MKGSFPDGVKDRACLQEKWLTEKEAVPWAGVTLVLGGPRAAEALDVTRLAAQSLLIPVLRGGTFLVRHAVPMAVQPQAFQTGRAGPSWWAGLAGPGAICGQGRGSRQSESGQDVPVRNQFLLERLFTCLPCFFQRFLGLCANSVESWIGHCFWALSGAFLLLFHILCNN